MIWWFTGQPGSGKTTLAYAWAHELDAAIVDGDELRRLCPTGYDAVSRLANVYRAQGIATWQHGNFHDVCVAVVAPNALQRDEFKRAMGNAVQEIYLHYAGDRGKGAFQVGDYQIPTAPALRLDTSQLTVSQCLAKLRKLERA